MLVTPRLEVIIRLEPMGRARAPLPSAGPATIEILASAIVLYVVTLPFVCLAALRVATPVPAKMSAVLSKVQAPVASGIVTGSGISFGLTLPSCVT